MSIVSMIKVLLFLIKKEVVL